MNKKRILAFICLTIVLLLLFSQLEDPYMIDKSHQLQGSSLEHLFGTDYLGRDLFSRIVHGSFYSLVIAVLSLTGVVLVSLLFGGLSARIGGLFDACLMTFSDILVSIPSLILALVFTGLFSNSLLTVMIALIISWSGKYIRYVRNLVLDISKEEFVVLASLRGSFGSHTLLWHIIPNIFTKLLALFVTDLGKLLLSISGLSFLGIGIQPPTPELGTILYDGRAYFFAAPQLFIFPGFALSGIVLATQAISQKINKCWRYGND